MGIARACIARIIAARVPMGVSIYVPSAPGGRPSCFMLLAAFMAFGLAGCTALQVATEVAQKVYVRDNSASSAQVPSRLGLKASPVYKVGDPYKVKGVWYYPKRDLSYDETGIASWYGDEFAGRLTANGEIFEPDRISAAHKTLPMPSVVRVTNLENGRSLVVRVNDRGPFVRGRIIDLSREAARLLGFRRKGIAKVRVKLLLEQSLRAEELAKRGKFPGLGSNKSDEEAKPDFTGVGSSDVTFSANSSSGRSVYNPEDGQSAIELLAKRPRVGDVNSVAATHTKIWIQVGAFRSRESAEAVLDRVDGLGAAGISSVTSRGQRFYRVRLGPMRDVSRADRMLDGVVELGFPGARIVVD